MPERGMVARAAAKKLIGGAYRSIGPLVTFPVPAYDLMRRTGPKTLWQYWDGGVRSYLPIATLAEAHGVDLQSPVDVLDFGCGVGRQLAQFTRDYPAPTYAACDVNPAYVDFVRRAYPSVEASVSGFRPPLDYADDRFDLVYSVSVFSHLPPEDHVPWLKELSRIVKPGGCALLTIEGATAVRKRMATKVWAEDPNDAVTVLQRDGVRYLEYPDLGWHKRNEGSRLAGMKYGGVDGSYGNTAMTPSYVREQWSDAGFDVVGVVEGVIGRRQDVVVLRSAA